MRQAVIFHPSNELTFNTVSADRERLFESLKDAEVKSLRIDLSQVKHCDSAGLALLIEAKRLCKQYNKMFVIDKIPLEVSALAEFCGLEAILNEYE